MSLREVDLPSDPSLDHNPEFATAFTDDGGTNVVLVIGPDWKTPNGDIYFDMRECRGSNPDPDFDQAGISIDKDDVPLILAAIQKAQGRTTE